VCAWLADVAGERKNARGDADRFSVPAPVGSALLGLATGDQIEWPVSAVD
jgi:transcription elongation GreA/GreB family factor